MTVRADTRTRSHRVAKALVLMMVVAIAAVLPQIPMPRAQAVGYIDTHQFNMCSYNCNKSLGSEAKDTVLYLVGNANPRPWVISLNEVCLENVYNAIQPQMNSWGYTGWFNPTIPTFGLQGCSQFGNAVFTLGGYLSVYRLTYSSDIQNPSAAFGEKRNAVCLKSTSFVGDYAGCSTHLDVNVNYAEPQADQFGYLSAVNYGSLQRFLGGDFNLSPWDTHIQNFYNGFNEADGCAQGCITTTVDFYKFDYTWAKRENFWRARDTDPFFVSSPTGGYVSDHKYYPGHFACC